MLLKIVLHVEQNSNILDKNVVEHAQINEIIKCGRALDIGQLSRSSSFPDLSKCVHV